MYINERAGEPRKGEEEERKRKPKWCVDTKTGEGVAALGRIEPSRAGAPGQTSESNLDVLCHWTSCDVGKHTVSFLIGNGGNCISYLKSQLQRCRVDSRLPTPFPRLSPRSPAALPAEQARPRKPRPFSVGGTDWPV